MSQCKKREKLFTLCVVTLQDILARRFVEHGEYEKSYYGTSLEAIRSVVSLEKICVLNLHPQSLKILKSSDLVILIYAQRFLPHLFCVLVIKCS